MIRNCEQCGEEFNVFPSRIKIGKGRFCSAACKDQNATTGRPTNATCEQCGNPYYVSPCDLQVSRYCGIKCRAQGQSIERKGEWKGPLPEDPIRIDAMRALNERRFAAHYKCDQCADIIKSPKGHRPGRNHFCNRTCYALWRTGTREIDGEPVLPTDRRTGMTLVLDNGKLKQV